MLGADANVRLAWPAGHLCICASWQAARNTAQACRSAWIPTWTARLRLSLQAWTVEAGGQNWMVGNLLFIWMDRTARGGPGPMAKEVREDGGSASLLEMTAQVRTQGQDISGRAEQVTLQLESAIGMGLLNPGERLPPESPDPEPDAMQACASPKMHSERTS